jgi:hypothetical protein
LREARLKVYSFVGEDCLVRKIARLSKKERALVLQGKKLLWQSYKGKADRAEEKLTICLTVPQFDGIIVNQRLTALSDIPVMNPKSQLAFIMEFGESVRVTVQPRSNQPLLAALMAYFHTHSDKICLELELYNDL